MTDYIRTHCTYGGPYRKGACVCQTQMYSITIQTQHMYCTFAWVHMADLTGCRRVIQCGPHTLYMRNHSGYLANVCTRVWQCVVEDDVARMMRWACA